MTTISVRLLDQLFAFWALHPVLRAIGLVAIGVLVLCWLISVVSVYLWAPYVLYKTNVIETANENRVIDVANGEPVHAEVEGYVSGAEHSLRALGFSDPLRFTTGHDSPLGTLASLQEHPTRGDLATIIAIRKETVHTFQDFDGETYEMPKVRRSYVVSFRTRFADGLELVTGNSHLVRYWPERPTERLVRFPEVVDAAELYGLHRTRVAERARHHHVAPLTRGSTSEQWMSRERSEAEKFYEHLVACGYRTRTAETLRFTVRGALLSAWRHAWPWRQIARHAERRAARGVLRAQYHA